MAQIETVDMHTGGEPVRIVTRGFARPAGATILAKRRDMAERQDDLRRLLMFEPRGHADMYGVVLVDPDSAEADLGALFMHNEGWSTMCGHAVIALGRFAVDRKLVPVIEPETVFSIQCPCGLVEVRTQVACGKSGRVSFRSVPAFAAGLDRVLDVEGIGPVMVDVGYGGAFYAVADAAQFGLDVRRSPVKVLAEIADAITRAGKRQLVLDHPDDPDLAFLYGTILTDGGDGRAIPSANVCVFAEREVDRSPTGSGVTARMAIMHRRHMVKLAEMRRFESITGSIFQAQVSSTSRAGQLPAVVVEVEGRAYYIGRSVFLLEEGDELGKGFLLR